MSNTGTVKRLLFLAALVASLAATPAWSQFGADSPERESRAKVSVMLGEVAVQAIRRNIPAHQTEAYRLLVPVAMKARR